MRIPNFVIGIFLIFPSRGGDNEQRTEMRFFWKERKRKKKHFWKKTDQRETFFIFIFLQRQQKLYLLLTYLCFFTSINVFNSFIIATELYRVYKVQSNKMIFFDTFSHFFRMNNNFWVVQPLPEIGWSHIQVKLFQIPEIDVILTLT